MARSAITLVLLVCFLQSGTPGTVVDVNRLVDQHLRNVSHILDEAIRLTAERVAFDRDIVANTMHMYRVDDERVPWTLRLGQRLMNNSIFWSTTVRREVWHKMQLHLDDLAEHAPSGMFGNLLKLIRAHFVDAMENHRRISAESDRIILGQCDREHKRMIEIHKRAVQHQFDADFDVNTFEAEFARAAQSVRRIDLTGVGNAGSHFHALLYTYGEHLRNIVCDVFKE